MRFALILSLVLGSWRLVEGADGAGARIDFNRQIQPLLADNCYHCHGPDEKTRKAKLRLDTREGAFQVKGGVGVIVAGKSSESELIRRISSSDPDEQMPPPDSKRKLTAAQIELLRRWVDQGAAWAKHWAFVTPSRPRLPKVQMPAWPRNGIDFFVLSRLEQEGLEPSPEAGKETLLRRLSLDLTGVPPTPSELDRFLADSSPGAYERVVDRLMASPRYGERMVWDWLEAGRYADSNGYQGDPNRTLWHWRDWAVQALNDNLPFDEFTTEQLAGDLLPKPSTSQLVATGFHRNHMINGEGGRIEEESRVDYVQDRVETTSTVWLGLTMTCARCHDHKYDPVTQREYYQLYAYFNNIAETGGADAWPNAKPILKLATAEQTARIAELEGVEKRLRQQREELEVKLRTAQPVWEAEVLSKATAPTPGEGQRSEVKGATEAGPGANSRSAAIPSTVAEALRVPAKDRNKDESKLIEDFYFKLSAERSELIRGLEETSKLLKEATAAVPVTMIMAEREKPRDSFVLVRGAYDKPAEKVAAGLPAVLPAPPPDAPANRLGLALWLTSPVHPLTARVTVNRYWQTLFGTGLVKTVDDFGVQGEKPSHPELLDWLATEFVSGGWDVKAIQKLMVMSATYRQSSKVRPLLLERDPENRLLARGSRFRLPSWMLRDQALFLSGLLVEKLGGKPVKPYQPPGVWEDATFGQIVYQQDTGEKLYRRSVYTFWRRIVGPTMFFDVASRQNCNVRQPRTNTPLHALATLNDITYVEAARALAERVLLSGVATDRERIDLAFRLCTARHPTDDEVRVLESALGRLRREYEVETERAAELLVVGESKSAGSIPPAELAAHAGLCSLLLNLDETLTKE